jgi:Spy/CpxP family protein refolding chaperone
MNRFSTAARTLAATALGITALAATVAVAQPPAYGPAAQTASVDWAQTRLDRMAWRLNLTEEQKAKLKPVLEERQALRTAQRAAMRNQLAQVLTPQQLVQFDQMRGQRGSRRFGAGPCGGGGPGFGRGGGYGTGPRFGATN